MGIAKIRINNFKSLKNIAIKIESTDDVYCLLGRNGVGKSNIIDAIKYFYDCLNAKIKSNNSYIDNVNQYSQKMEIEIIYDLKNLQRNNTNTYIEELMKEVEPYIRKKKLILRLTEYKDGSREWYPDNNNLRKYIKKLFPIYLIDTRFIQLQDWSKIWDIISELAISNIKIKETEIHSKLDNLFKEIYGDKYSRAIKRIEDIFTEENIVINTSDYTSRIKNALLTRLGGEEFLNEGNKLSYYSDGLNSLKYIKLLIRLVGLLSETGWKNPLILMDEPEIGLHPYYIQELTIGLSQSLNNRLNLILSTHSPYLINDIIKNNIRVSLNRVYINEEYTFIERIGDIVEQKEKFLITTKETECYFANAIVCIEGKSEMQVFCHPKIIKLFKGIGKIKFYQYNSDNNSMKLIHPSRSNFSIPYLTIVDMDKIIKYKDKDNTFKINSDSLVNPMFNKEIGRKEQYLYYEKGSNKYWTYNLRRYLKKTLAKSKFKQSRDMYWIEDEFFASLLKKIRIYCSEYNVLPLYTTIEGSLVNIKNVEIVIEWLESIFEIDDANNLKNILEKDLTILGSKNLRYRTTIIRLILNGKLDNLKTLEEAVKSNYIDKVTKTQIQKLNRKIGGKTEGWIINFMDYYFDKYIEHIDNEQNMKKIFKKDFQELSLVLQIFNHMIV